jgi:hypothetical protein
MLASCGRLHYPSPAFRVFPFWFPVPLLRSEGHFQPGMPYVAHFQGDFASICRISFFRFGARTWSRLRPVGEPDLFPCAHGSIEGVH